MTIVMATLVFDMPLQPLIIRILTTAFIVIAVSWSVGAFGPLIGGALAGLPIILGPGFYFLANQAAASFIAQAASYSLLSLCATQCFLLAYIVAARRAKPWLCLAFALTAWLLAAFVLRLVPPRPLLGIVLFCAATWVCSHIGRRMVVIGTSAKRETGFGLLAIRGVLAGLLVAVVTYESQRLGPTASGLLLAFPIGYTVVSITIHQKYSAATAMTTLYSTVLGTASLAGFCAALALTAVHLSINAALASALATSMIITIGLIIRWRFRMALR